VTVRADDGSPLVSNSFNPFEGYPNQNKIGDYITIVSDHTGAMWRMLLLLTSTRTLSSMKKRLLRASFSKGDTVASTYTAAVALVNSEW
jgi:hypothetical protein